jgi:hypothetical protein
MRKESSNRSNVTCKWIDKAKCVASVEDSNGQRGCDGLSEVGQTNWIADLHVDCALTAGPSRWSPQLDPPCHHAIQRERTCPIINTEGACITTHHFVGNSMMAHTDKSIEHCKHKQSTQSQTKMKSHQDVEVSHRPCRVSKRN